MRRPPTARARSQAAMTFPRGRPGRARSLPLPDRTLAVPHQRLGRRTKYPQQHHIPANRPRAARGGSTHAIIHREQPLTITSTGGPARCPGIATLCQAAANSEGPLVV